ncbi:hypothetical protein MASR2M8_04100 [Opitutaceae bacterium]
MNVRQIKIPAVKPPWWIQGRVLALLATAGGVCLFLLIYAYWVSETDFGKRIDFSVKTAFGSAALMSLLVAYQTLRLNIYKDQVKGTFEFLSRFDRAEEKKARNDLDALFSRAGSLREYLFDDVPEPRMRAFNEVITAEEKEAARTVMAFFEDVALAVRTGYASEAVMYRSLGPVAILYVNALRPYIEHVRQRDLDPLYFEDSMIMLRHWRYGVTFRLYVEKQKAAQP